MTIVVAGRSYPVKVNKEEERILPIIEKNLNEQIRQIQISYSDRDMQDCLTMVLLTQAIAAYNPEPSILPEISTKVENLNQEIEALLV